MVSLSFYRRTIKGPILFQFYSETILSRRGPLGKVWLAAHMERKLSKTQTLQTDIEQSVGLCSFLFTTWNTRLRPLRQTRSWVKKSRSWHFD